MGMGMGMGMGMEKKSRVKSVLSWADEVEKEEEAELEIESDNQKTNPFGSAKPIEVVLQERGIHWRDLDQQLHISSSSSPSSSRNEPGKKKPLKKNVYAPAPANKSKKQPLSTSRVPEHVGRDDGLKQNGSESPGDSVLVPPLKYPSKAYVNGGYFQNYVHSLLPLQQTWKQNVQLLNHHDDKTKKILQEPGTPWSHQGGRIYQQMHVGGKNMVAKDWNGRLNKTPGNNRMFGKQVTNQVPLAKSITSIKRNGFLAPELEKIRQRNWQLQNVEAAFTEFN